MNNINNSISLLKKQRLTKSERAQLFLPAELKDILIGLVLGDLFIGKATVNSNPRCQFKQSTIHDEYLLHIYELFKNYCTSAPKLKIEARDKRTGKVYTANYFYSYCLPCFKPIYNLFYLDGKKIVPGNIEELLTVSSLAYWLCDDGCFCKSTHRVYLYTQAFTLKEVNLLMSALNNKWNLECRKVCSGSGYIILIPRKSLPILQLLIKDIMPSMMKHKIGL